PHEVREKIFHPFFTTKEKGSGLGLYIVRRIVRAHGGEVHLRSRPGRTSFVVFLPWKPNIR
ncbi:MAG TPA: two-component sensor histidine kinase, partial [Firmicutes bacterium]|nr:two-component sensor histidine kinase [Bacillota bacterium]